jgi:hypothetical protein
VSAADVYELHARVVAALEAVTDGNLVDAEAILEDLERDIARAEKDTGDE